MSLSIHEITNLSLYLLLAHCWVKDLALRDQPHKHSKSNLNRKAKLYYLIHTVHVSGVFIEPPTSPNVLNDYFALYKIDYNTLFRQGRSRLFSHVVFISSTSIFSSSSVVQS